MPNLSVDQERKTRHEPVFIQSHIHAARKRPLRRRRRVEFVISPSHECASLHLQISW